MIIWIAGAVLASFGAQDVPAPQATTQAAESPALVAARNNRAKMKTGPKFKSGPGPDTPAPAKAIGAHGEVRISAIIGTDGHMTEAKPILSSNSPILDARALEIAAQTVFDPALDADGKPIPVSAVLPLQFGNIRSPGKGGGVLRYRCDQFVRDQDWWKATWPADKHDEFYTMSVGILVLKPGGLDADGLKERLAAFDQRFAGAIEACRKAPDKIAIDMMGEEGKIMRKLAEQAK